MFIAKKQTHHCDKQTRSDVTPFSCFLRSSRENPQLFLWAFFFVGRCGEHGGKKKRQQNNDFAVIFFLLIIDGTERGWCLCPENKKRCSTLRLVDAAGRALCSYRLWHDFSFLLLFLLYWGFSLV